jgi:metal-responsive CopG/Arc/MetJ family transcriptional regulator
MAKKVASDPVVADKGDKIPVTVRIDAELLAEIDNYRRENRIEGRAQTVRALLVCALHPENND